MLFAKQAFINQTSQLIFLYDKNFKLQRLSSTPGRSRCVSVCLVSILFFNKNLFQLKIKAVFKANNKAVSLMLFLVYLLLILNITISFSSVVCKKAFILLKIGYDYDYDHVMKQDNDYDYGCY